MNHIVSRSDGQTMGRIVRKPLSSVLQSSTPGTEVLDDGSMLITAEQLARFGGGDAKAGRRELRLLLAEEREPVPPGVTKKPANVRVARPKDENAVLDLLLLDLNDNAAHIAPVDEAKVMLAIQVGTRDRGGFTAVIDGPDGKPVAAMLIHPCQWWWGNAWYFFEVANYVHKDHRKSNYANDLLDFARWVSDEQSRGFGYVVRLVCGVLGAWRVQAKVALYRRKFRQSGAAFVYPAPPLKEG